MRKHYCVYVDRFSQCERLTDQELGRLHRALMRTYTTGELQELAGRESIVYGEMAEDVARDVQKQGSKSEQAKKAISLRWDKVRTYTDVYGRIRTYTNVYERIEPLQDKGFQQPEPPNSTIYISNNTTTSYSSTSSNTIVDEKEEKDTSDKEIHTRGKKGGAGGKEGAIFREIVDYLNEKAGTKYRAATQSTRGHINARLKEGYTLPDFQTVIDKKCAEWLGTDMEQYLRPETLFGSKFENYLNAPQKPAGRKREKESWSFEDFGKDNSGNDDSGRIFVEPEQEERGFPF